MRERKRVAVIGAGPSGLACIKELAEVGHDVMAFEEQPTLGGVYASHQHDFILTTSTLTTSFGAWPTGREDRPFLWTRKEYLEYLRSYAEHFDLLSRVRFNTPVRRLLRTPGSKGWRLHVGSADRAEVLDVDGVALCCGLNRSPDDVRWPGQERFLGRILHASDYRSAEAFADKRILVVGLGESGSDITLETARVAKRVAVSTRQGPGFVIPRYFAGLPSDIDTNRCYHAIPYRFADRAIVRFKTRLESAFLTPADDRSVQRAADDINRQGGLGPFRRFGTKNTSFVEAMLRYGVESRPDVDSFDEAGVVFTDGSRFDCDVVIRCTGYRSDLSLLSVDHPELAALGANPRKLYKRMIHPSVGSSLAWIGLVRPGIGSIPPCAELQARYFALLTSGERRLPSKGEMARDLRIHERLDFDQYPRDASRLAALTDYLRFMDSIAEVIGCRPTLRCLLWKDTAAWARVMFGPITGLQYRLEGPGSARERARAALMRTPTMPLPVLAYELLCLAAGKLMDRTESIIRAEE